MGEMIKLDQKTRGGSPIMLGKKIQQLRKEYGMSQEELASKLTISRQAISKWELGESVPDTENVVQLSKLFGVTTDFLLYDEYENDKDAQEARASCESADDALPGHQEERAEASPIKRKFYKKPVFWIVIAAGIVLITLVVLLFAGLLFTVVDTAKNTQNPPGAVDVEVETPNRVDPQSQSVYITYKDHKVSDITLIAGEEITLGIMIPPTVSGNDIEWHSSNQGIFGVVLTNTTGSEVMVTAISGGTATLSASVGGFQAECIVRVRAGQNNPVMDDDLQAQLARYLSELFTEAYAPHYDGLHFLLSQYEETVDGNNYTSTFLWTMYHLANGLDIPGDYGKEQEGNWHLQATARIVANNQLDTASIVVLQDNSVTGPPNYVWPVIDNFPPPPATPPVDKELVRDYIQQYMLLITNGDTAELARFLLIDGGVTDKYVEIAKRVIEYYAQYDIRRATVQSVHYHEIDYEQQYTIRQYIILVRDGRGEMFKVYAGYGDGLVGIDVKMFE